MQPNWNVLVPILAFLLGGGILTRVGLGALRSALEEKFVTHDQMDELKGALARVDQGTHTLVEVVEEKMEGAMKTLGDRLDAMLSLYTAVRERSDDNADRIHVLQAADRERWVPIGRTIERAVTRLEALERQGAEIAVLLNETSKRFDDLAKRFDRHDERIRTLEARKDG